MKRVIALLALACALGCGKDKADNSKVQSPGDQPIGQPQNLGGQPGGSKRVQLGSGGQPGKGLPNIEVKQ